MNSPAASAWVRACFLPSAGGPCCLVRIPKATKLPNSRAVPDLGPDIIELLAGWEGAWGSPGRNHQDAQNSLRTARLPGRWGRTHLRPKSRDKTGVSRGNLVAGEPAYRRCRTGSCQPQRSETNQEEQGNHWLGDGVIMES